MTLESEKFKDSIRNIFSLQGEDPSSGNPNFWDELFLLRVNSTYIENEFDKLNGDQLVALKVIR